MDIKKIDTFRKRNRIFVILLIGLLALVSLEFSEVNEQSVLIGGPILLLGMLIRLWTNGTIIKSKEVCNRGLYSVSRHPMYVGTAAASIGLAIMLSNNYFIALIVVALVISFIRAKAEEKKLSDRFPGYSEYRKRVPALPTPVSIFKSVKGGSILSGWSLRLTYENGEVNRLNLYLLITVASFMYLLFRGKGPEDILYYHAGFLGLFVLSVFSFLLYPSNVRYSKGLYILCMVSACAGSFFITVI